MTYTIYTWDCEEACWDAYERGLSLFGLRRLLRMLCGERRSWDDPMIRTKAAWGTEAVKVCRDDLDVESPFDRHAEREERQWQIEYEREEAEREAAAHPLLVGLD